MVDDIRQIDAELLARVDKDLAAGALWPGRDARRAAELMRTADA
jgi:hypothetical protein